MFEYADFRVYLLLHNHINSQGFTNSCDNKPLSAFLHWPSSLFPLHFSLRQPRGYYQLEWISSSNIYPILATQYAVAVTTADLHCIHWPLDCLALQKEHTDKQSNMSPIWRLWISCLREGNLISDVWKLVNSQSECWEVYHDGCTFMWSTDNNTHMAA